MFQQRAETAQSANHAASANHELGAKFREAQRARARKPRGYPNKFLCQSHIRATGDTHLYALILVHATARRHGAAGKRRQWSFPGWTDHQGATKDRERDHAAGNGQPATRRGQRAGARPAAR